jgi:hypothetical protein
LIDSVRVDNLAAHHVRTFCVRIQIARFVRRIEAHVLGAHDLAEEIVRAVVVERRERTGSSEPSIHTRCDHGARNDATNLVTFLGLGLALVLYRQAAIIGSDDIASEGRHLIEELVLREVRAHGAGRRRRRLHVELEKLA